MPSVYCWAGMSFARGTDSLKGKGTLVALVVGVGTGLLFKLVAIGEV